MNFLAFIIGTFFGGAVLLAVLAGLRAWPPDQARRRPRAAGHSSDDSWLR